MVVNYEVVVEIDDEPWNSSSILPPDVTSFELPEEILRLSDEIKFRGAGTRSKLQPVSHGSLLYPRR